MLTRQTTTTIPSPEAQQQSILQHQQKLRESLQQAAEERMRLRLERLHRRHQALAQAQSLKALYRQAAARLHPDRARDAAERQYRHQVMSRVNLAYQACDLQQLQTIVHNHETSS